MFAPKSLVLLAACGWLAASSFAVSSSPKAGMKDEDALSAPPGMVSFQGGRTQVGVDTKDVQKMLDEYPELLESVSPLDAETPAYTANVNPFHLMVTEVTNEQYREFIRANEGVQPPMEWASAALEAGRQAFFDSMKDMDPKERQGMSFEPRDWWDANWQEAQWEVAPEDLLLPVVYVTYQDALDYCEWAGLRLPTQEELQHAIRGRTDHPYPWGTDATPGVHAVTGDIQGLRAPMPVGWIPAGKTEEGVQDLIGNAWEWTDTPYSPHKGWKPHKYKVGTGKNKQERTSDPDWNGDRRVCAGGSWQLPIIAARASIRRGTARTQRTSDVSFRAAASVAAAQDKSASLYQKVVRLSPARADGVTYDSESAFGWVRWTSRASEVGEKEIKDLVKKYRNLRPKVDTYAVPSGYEVITGFDYALFTPSALIDTNDVKGMQRDSLGEPLHLGYLSISRAMLQPALQPGTYMVAYRHDGEMPEPEKSEEDPKNGEEEEVLPPPDWVAKIDLKKSNLLFLDAITGELAAHVEVKESPETLQNKKLASEDRVAGLRAVTKKERGQDDKGKPIFVEVPWLQFDVVVPAKVSKTSWVYRFDVQPPAEFVELDWRR